MSDNTGTPVSNISSNSSFSPFSTPFGLTSPRTPNSATSSGGESRSFLNSFCSTPISSNSKQTRINQPHWEFIDVPGVPKERGFHSAVVVNDKMYIIGGDRKEVQYFDDIHSFDLRREVWEQRIAKLPSPRTGHTTTLYDGFIYILGGKNETGYISEFLRCPISDLNAWQHVPAYGRNLFRRRGAHSASLVDHCLYVFGGIKHSQKQEKFKFLSDLLQFNFTRGEWTRLQTYGTPPSPRAGHTTTVVKKKLYIFGGRFQGQLLGDLHEFDTRSMSWIRVRADGTIPSARAGHSMCHASGYLVLWGGSDWKEFFSDIYFYDLVTKTWYRPEIKGETPPGRFWNSYVIYGTTLYIFGGGTKKQLYNDLCAFDTRPVLDSLENLPMLSSPPSVERIQGRVVIKPYLGDDLRQLEIGANINYEQLIALIREEFGSDKIPSDALVSLKYEDTEGDIVTLQSDAHLKRAIQGYFGSKRSLKVKVSLSQQERRQQQLFNWQKADELGRGAFGTVYLGLTSNGEFIAVKEVPLRRKRIIKQQIDTLEREVSFMKAFSHQNIVQYLGTQRTENMLRIFLEFVSGGSILSLLGKFKRLNEHVIQSYIKQILLGLEYLHSKGIVHRDIKAANILVSERGTIKLADFGASQYMSKIAGSKSIEGTVCWMAPEVVKAPDTVDDKADIWSVGCTIIEMATGEIPWTRDYDKLDRFRMFKILSYTTQGPSIPEHLSFAAKDFLNKCFVISAQDRPSASELLQHHFITEPLDIPESEPYATEEDLRRGGGEQPQSEQQPADETASLSFVESAASSFAYTTSSFSSDIASYSYNSKSFDEEDYPPSGSEPETEDSYEYDEDSTEDSSLTSEDGSYDPSQDSYSTGGTPRSSASSDDTTFNNRLDELLGANRGSRPPSPRNAVETNVVAPEADMDKIQEYLQTSSTKWAMKKEGLSHSLNSDHRSD
eukprot:gb/GECH01004658.1/.p1 GENE.gb/GECH01004658.1/~~gb/GECH01004658.1/.p1  ORF type:complete len:948 (+),score=193.41 gb/GECH01004658.1/:1-2844(+)